MFEVSWSLLWQSQCESQFQCYSLCQCIYKLQMRTLKKHMMITNVRQLFIIQVIIWISRMVFYAEYQAYYRDLLIAIYFSLIIEIIDILCVDFLKFEMRL